MKKARYYLFLYGAMLLAAIFVWDTLASTKDSVMPVSAKAKILSSKQKYLIAKMEKENQMEQVDRMVQQETERQEQIKVAKEEAKLRKEKARAKKAKKRAAQRAAKKAAKSKSVKKVVKASTNINMKEKTVLRRIVEAEAGGQDLIGRILVANVILNRVHLKKYPKTIKGVVFAHADGCYQFSPVEDGRFFKVRVSDKTKKAVDQALKGVDYSKGALFFMCRASASKRNARWFDQRLKFLFKHGDHEFFR